MVAICEQREWRHGLELEIVFAAINGCIWWKFEDGVAAAGGGDEIEFSEMMRFWVLRPNQRRTEAGVGSEMDLQNELQLKFWYW